MDTIGELVSRERRSREPALRARTGVNARYDYYQLCTTAHKTGNFLSHRGVRPGERVAVVASEGGAPVLTLFGAALLGARVRFDPPREIDARVLVAPAEAIGEYDLPPSATRLAYDGEPADPAVESFGESVWSENPFCPTPPEVDPETPFLATDEREYGHGELLAAAERVVERLELTAGDRVAIRASLSRPGTVVAGVLAPLSVGATVVFPGSGDEGDVGVVGGDARAPESVTIYPADVPLL
jgi:hypothetical protein